MTLRLRTIGASAGLGVAAAVAALAFGGASGASGPASTEARPLEPGPPLTPAQNRLPLTGHTRKRLSRWAERVTSCMARRGAPVGKPRASRDEIVIRVSAARAKDPLRLAARMQPCARALGGPPPGSAIVVQRGGRTIRLYKPRTCLFPEVAKQ